jgi:hypothetical protein
VRTLFAYSELEAALRPILVKSILETSRSEILKTASNLFPSEVREWKKHKRRVASEIVPVVWTEWLDVLDWFQGFVLFVPGFSVKIINTRKARPRPRIILCSKNMNLSPHFSSGDGQIVAWTLKSVDKRLNFSVKLHVSPKLVSYIAACLGQTTALVRLTAQFHGL